jgi:ectoine hydroxylase-related dioxygenase (phytanoyl-CoA dioxygenase family)
MDLNSPNKRMLTSQQLHAFHTDGYLRMQAVLPLSLLKQLHQLFDELMIPDTQIEKVIHENNGNKYVTNLDNICCKGNLACLELLGYSPVLEIAEQICGKDFFLIQEFAVIKNLGDDLPVYWHQDMVHRRTGNCFTMGIYLDNADEDDGALRMVPASHLSHKNICELSREPSVEVPMQAGDILIHDMMLAHSSGVLTKNLLRRVIYFEFLPAAQVAAENIYTKELVQRRTRLQYAASRHYRLLYPEEKQFVHPVPNAFAGDEEKGVIEILKEIYSLPINARPSTYCFDNKIAFSVI